MFELDQFIADCRTASAETSRTAVRDVVSRAIAAPNGILKALGEPKGAGTTILYRTPELSIFNIVWGPGQMTTPHNHHMWAVIGLYTGREDNIYWRKTGGEPGLQAANARSLGAGECELLGPELIHSVEAIRGLIGARTTAHSLAWATTIQAQLVDHPNDTHDSQRIAAIVADDGPAFVALAEHSDRFVGWSQSSRTPTPRVGDLLAFDFVDNNRPASLFAVVLSIDDRGVVEMAYAGAGVVRRGFVDVNHPSARRDHDGRVCNTYMRHGKDWPPAGTHYLAGELVRGAIR